MTLPAATLVPLSIAVDIAASPAWQAVADTLYTVPVRSGLTIAAQVALVIIATVFLGIAVWLALLLRSLRKLTRDLGSVGDRVMARARPILDSGKGAAENVEFISSVVRRDVEELNETVQRLSGRLRDASAQMEERIDAFNALMDVVQDEAEDIFLGTAATARGVREGVRSLGGDGDDGSGPRSDRARARPAVDSGGELDRREVAESPAASTATGVPDAAGAPDPAGSTDGEEVD